MSDQLSPAEKEAPRLRKESELRELRRLVWKYPYRAEQYVKEADPDEYEKDWSDYQKKIPQ